MGINLFAGQPNVVVAKQTISFELAGITADNTAVIFFVSDGLLKSYVPGRLINAITGFVKDKGYYIVPLINMDLQNWTLPPIVQPSKGVPLIIFSGESNSGGFALNSDATTQELAPRPNVQILNNDTLLFEDLHIGVNNTIGHTGLSNGPYHGWELMLANRMDAGTFVQAPLYLVKTGQGGSLIEQWEEDAPEGYWNTFQERVDEAIDLLTASTGSAPTLYLFYSQGINNVLNSGTAPAWIDNTLAHFDKIRAKYGHVPIVMTKFMTTHPILNEAIDELVPQRSDIYSVFTEDATLKDPNHWDYAGLKLVSGRMQDVLLQNYAV